MDKPVLWYHDRQNRGEALPDEVVSALVRLATTEAISSADRTVYSEVIHRLDEENLWLSCGCVGVEGDQPILFPRRRKNAVLHLVRKGKLKHADGCPFDALASRADLTPDDDDIDGGPWVCDWLHLEGPLDTYRQRPAASSERGGARISTLDRQLWTLLDEAGYTTLDVADLRDGAGSIGMLDRKAHYARLHRLDGKLMGPGVTFKQVACTYLPDLPKQLVRAGPHDPARVAGYFLGVIDSIDIAGGAPAVLVWDASALPPVLVPVRQVIQGAVEGGQAGPYWILARITENPERNGWLCVADATALMALNRACLLPLRSSAERPLVHRVVEQAAFWRGQGIRAPIRLHAPAPSRGQRPALEIHIGTLGKLAVAAHAGDVAVLETTGRYACVVPPPPAEDGMEWRRQLTAAAWRVIKSSRKVGG